MSETENTKVVINENPVDPTGKWTEIEHLHEWAEEYYLVYTAKKHGKWVMMKTLRPEYRDTEKGKALISKEFDVRYNLSHPNIVMINDLEEVPGVGLSIICDDVYGDSLAKLINEDKLTEHHIEQLKTRLPSALQYISENHLLHHPITSRNIIFTQNIGNLKLIDVGFEQRPNLSPRHLSQDVAAFGRVMLEALDAVPAAKGHGKLKHIAQKCASATLSHNPYPSIANLQMALSGRNLTGFLMGVIVFLIILMGVLVWLNSSSAPKHPGQQTQIENTK